MYAHEYTLLGGNASEMENTESSLMAIRHGLPLAMVDEAAKVLGINKGDLGSLIGLSIRSLQRNKAKRLSPQQSEHTLAVLKVFNEASAYFGDQATALTWLKTPQVYFGEHEPLSYLDTMTGIDIILDVINRLKHGMTA